MDWKYKHFHLERTYSAAGDEVLEAARVFMSESLGWEVATTADGLTAQGYSFAHHSIANLHLQSAGSGTNVVIELLVERASSLGYMLFDFGGYYDIQIRKWLDGIQWVLHQKLTGSHDESTNPLVLAQNKTSAYVFNGCLVFIAVMFGIYLLVMLISAVVGLLTGTLFLVGRGGTLTLHGSLARILSAFILLMGAFLVWRIKRKPAAQPRTY